ncbi:LSU methyltransferase RlmH [Clostridiaceae bacterium JG1575]|nr:LSU methyltransferase RlmH [Clostridiaceae bacterium JG1575]
MNQRILCVGSLKEPYAQKTQEELLGLLHKKIRALDSRATLDLLEVQDEATPAQATPAHKKAVLAAEGRRMLDKIPARAFVVLLDLGAQSATPEGVRTLTKKAQESGADDLVWIVGGSLGLDEALRKRANARMALSDLTFPHQLFRLALLQALLLYL